MAQDRSFSVDDPVRRRTLVAGVAGLGLAGLLGIGVARAQAQESDDMDDADEWLDDDVDDLDDQAENAARAEAYQDFLGKVTTNLGMSDTAAVDLAIREALKAMVDERFAAGEISRNNADTLKERIDTSAAPIGILSLGRRMARRRDRRSGRNESDGGLRTEPTGDGSSATPSA